MNFFAIPMLNDPSTRGGNTPPGVIVVAPSGSPFNQSPNQAFQNPTGPTEQKNGNLLLLGGAALLLYFLLSK